MQNANSLFAVMQERGRKGQPVERLYRMLYNPELYLKAYAKLYPNKGAMTPGATPETVDGMSLGKINNIIEAIRYERPINGRPVRRTYIKKANGKNPPLDYRRGIHTAPHTEGLGIVAAIDKPRG